MIKTPLIVVGGTVREAQEYCRREGLGLGQAVIIADYYGLMPLRGSRPGTKVRFIGTFRARVDAGQILNEVKVRGFHLEHLEDDHV